MIAEFRASVAEHLEATTSLPTHYEIPDDVAALPCIVVGRVGIGPGAAAAVLDLDLDVFVLGRAQTAGGRDEELDLAADEVLTALGGSRTVNTADGTNLMVVSMAGRTAEAAGKSYPAYVLTVETSAITC